MIDKSLLTFDEEKHIYYYDGKPVTSVTQVLKPISQKIYGEVPTNILEKAADRGSSIHYAIDLFTQYGITELEDEYKPYLEAYKLFQKQFNHEVIHNEYPVYSELGYAGTLDNLGKVNGNLCLIDYKNVSKVHVGLVGLQLSAYRQGLKEEGIEVDKAACLQLKKDGKYKFIIYTKDQLDTYFEHFKTLLMAKKIIKFYSE